MDVTVTKQILRLLLLVLLRGESSSSGGLNRIPAARARWTRTATHRIAVERVCRFGVSVEAGTVMAVLKCLLEGSADERFAFTYRFN
jgi:hypothetical protein